MARLSIRRSTTVAKEENGGSCETCGHAFEAPIRLTNLSVSPAEVYSACPFCFSKQAEVEEAPVETPPSSVKDLTAFPKAPEDVKRPDGLSCPHYLGYLKKRPKNAPIPESCLTCPQMISCLL